VTQEHHLLGVACHSAASHVVMDAQPMRYAVPPPTALPTTSHAPPPPPTRPGGARHSVLTFAVAFRVSQGRTLAMRARCSGGMRVVPAAVRGGL